MGSKLIIQLINLFLIQTHFHHLIHQTNRRNTGNAVLTLEVWNHIVVGEIRQLIDILIVVIHRHIHGRQHIQANLHNAWAAAALRQGILHRIQGRIDLDQGGIHIGLCFKFQGNHAVILGTVGCDILDTGDRGEHAFQRLHDFQFHLLRGCARIGGDNHQIRCRNGRQQICGHFRQTNGSQHQYDNDSHQNGIRFLNALLDHLGPRVLSYLKKSQSSL